MFKLLMQSQQSATKGQLLLWSPSSAHASNAHRNDVSSSVDNSCVVGSEEVEEQVVPPPLPPISQKSFHHATCSGRFSASQLANCWS